jgi:hypothetical protein
VAARGAGTAADDAPETLSTITERRGRIFVLGSEIARSSMGDYANGKICSQLKSICSRISSVSRVAHREVALRKDHAIVDGKAFAMPLHDDWR